MGGKMSSEYMHNYYLANRDKWKTGEENPCACGCGGITQRKYMTGHNKRGMHPLESLRRKTWRRIRNNCLRPDGRSYGTTCTIPLENLPKIPDHCPCCGKEWDFSEKGSSENRPSLDRIIPSSGYITGNVTWVCGECNRRLSDSTPEQLRMLADFRERCLTQ